MPFYENLAIACGRDRNGITWSGELVYTPLPVTVEQHSECHCLQIHAKLLLQGEAEDEERGENQFDGVEETSGGGSGEGGADTVAMELLAFPQISVIDFGSIHINERATRKVRCCGS